MTQNTDIREQALSYMRHQASKSLGDLVALVERTAADCDRCLEDLDLDDVVGITDFLILLGNWG